MRLLRRRLGIVDSQLGGSMASFEHKPKIIAFLCHW